MGSSFWFSGFWLYHEKITEEEFIMLMEKGNESMRNKDRKIENTFYLPCYSLM